LNEPARADEPPGTDGATEPSPIAVMSGRWATATRNATADDERRWIWRNLQVSTGEVFTFGAGLGK
jgi:hypothetical protein